VGGEEEYNVAALLFRELLESSFDVLGYGLVCVGVCGET